MTDSLDELVGQFAAALEVERMEPWRAGDVVNRALADTRDEVLFAAGEMAGRDVDELPARLRRRVRSAQAKIIGVFAQAGQCTKSRVRQLSDVSGTFGTEQRWPDVPSWSWYRAVLNAARRTKDDPRALADDARMRNKSIAELNAVGKLAPADVLVLSAECAACGVAVRAKVSGQASAHADLASLALPCPVCAARAFQAGADGREAPRLGVLEAA